MYSIHVCRIHHFHPYPPERSFDGRLAQAIDQLQKETGTTDSAVDIQNGKVVVIGFERWKRGRKKIMLEEGHKKEIRKNLSSE
jgi:hypothetical protein